MPSVSWIAVPILGSNCTKTRTDEETKHAFLSADREPHHAKHNFALLGLLALLGFLRLREVGLQKVRELFSQDAWEEGRRKRDGRSSREAGYQHTFRYAVDVVQCLLGGFERAECLHLHQLGEPRHVEDRRLDFVVNAGDLL